MITANGSTTADALIKGVRYLPNLSLDFSKLNVFVTGAAGTIGSLILKALGGKCKALVGVDSSEEKVAFSNDPNLYLGRASVYQGFFIPDLVFHCAAYKHIHLGQRNAQAFYYNNVHETYVLANTLSMANPKARVIMASTDKASGTSEMGKSKAQAEKIITDHGGVSLRLVNLVRSSGSVVTRWERELERRRPVIEVVKGAVRYWMQPEDAKHALLYASLLPKGKYTVWGFPQVGIEDMARALIRAKKESTREYRRVVVREIPMRPDEVLEEALLAPDETAEECGTPWLREIIQPEEHLL